MIEEKLTAQKQQSLGMLSDVLVECQRRESAFLSAILAACDGCRQEVRRLQHIRELASLHQIICLHSDRHDMMTSVLLAGKVHKRGSA